MKICAIISEFNPFHFGHKWLIDKIKSDFSVYVVAIMSGNFVQRGEPAIISKNQRAQVALLGGVDLVLEIPAIWSLSTAERFAKAGVFLADCLSCVESLAFGSECGNVEDLKIVSKSLETVEFEQYLKENLKTGITFAKARELAIASVLDKKKSLLLDHPNNILGVEYLKALKKLNSDIKPIAIKRNENFISSSKIRNLAIKSDFYKNFLPLFSYDMLKNSTLRTLKNFEKEILYKFLTIDKNEIKNLPDISEGLENRIKKVAENATSLEEFFEGIKTKRYTMSRIKRIIMCGFLGISAEMQKEDPPYLKVLASNENGFKILKIAKKSAKLPIISRNSDFKYLCENSRKVFYKELIFDKICINGQKGSF